MRGWRGRGEACVLFVSTSGFHSLQARYGRLVKLAVDHNVKVITENPIPRHDASLVGGDAYDKEGEFALQPCNEGSAGQMRWYFLEQYGRTCHTLWADVPSKVLSLPELARVLRTSRCTHWPSRCRCRHCYNCCYHRLCCNC